MEINIRYLEKKDLDGVMSLLQNLSEYIPNKQEYDEIWLKYIDQNNVISVVAEYEWNVVGFATIFIEHKLRGGALGHVEDVVVDAFIRKKGIGRSMLKNLIEIGEKYNCYKITLSCNLSNVGFYDKCDFVNDGVAMSYKI